MDENADDDEILQGLEDAVGEDEEPEEEENADEIDASVEASDAAIVDKVAAEVNTDDSLPTLTRAEINLGCFSLSKVCGSLLPFITS